MIKVKYCIAAIIVVMLVCLFVVYSGSHIDRVINNDELSKTAVISVSVRDANSGKIIYERDGNLLLHPASTLKAFISPVILKYLGADNSVKTSLYKDNKGLYLKLCGDPLLTQDDLKALFKDANHNVLTIDDSAIDDVEWGVGWMWDDESNPLMPKISAYNVNHNLAILDNKVIPVKSPKENFLSLLNFNGRVKTSKVPENAVLVSEISRSVKEQIENINKNSDNLAAETLFKLAGSRYKGGTGTTEAGIEAFMDFYTSLGADPSEQLIIDASGVSHNNLVQANWMTLALHKLFNTPEFKDYPETLAKPGENGTLQNRLTHLSGNLWAKTGSLAGISGITGYMRTKRGKTYTFAILIQNVKGDLTTAKQFEDSILNELYLR